MGSANGLSAHLAVTVSIGSTSSHQTHFSSVLLFARTGTSLFPQCKQRVTLSIACPPSGASFLFLVSASMLERNFLFRIEGLCLMAQRERSDAGGY
jgi:hypothetical protein